MRKGLVEGKSGDQDTGWFEIRSRSGEGQGPQTCKECLPFNCTGNHTFLTRASGIPAYKYAENRTPHTS